MKVLHDIEMMLEEELEGMKSMNGLNPAQLDGIHKPQKLLNIQMKFARMAAMMLVILVVIIVGMLAVIAAIQGAFIMSRIITDRVTV